MRFPGSVSVSPEVYLGVVRQVALSAIDAGFRQVFLMGDHGGGQGELACAAEGLDQDWHARGVRVFYVPDLYFKEKEQMRAYLREHSIPEDRHAGTDDTSEIMYLDAAGEWIRRDKLAASDSMQESTTGVEGDPTRATAALGRVFIEYKVQNAVDQIRRLRRGGPVTVTGGLTTACS